MLDEQLQPARERLRQVREVDALVTQLADACGGLRLGGDGDRAAEEAAKEVRAALDKVKERF